MVALVIHHSSSGHKKKHVYFTLNDPPVVIIELVYALIEVLAKKAPKYPSLYPKTMLQPVNKAHQSKKPKKTNKPEAPFKKVPMMVVHHSTNKLFLPRNILPFSVLISKRTSGPILTPPTANEPSKERLRLFFCPCMAHATSLLVN